MISKSFSFYLEVLRALSALIVVVFHFRLKVFSGTLLSWFTYGDAVVMIFFVLSGLVISLVVDQKEKSAKVYFIKRISRLCSVALPAILLSVIGDALGLSTFEGHPTPTKIELITKVKDIGLFISEVWTTQNAFNCNPTFWSLIYEFWYYILFGLAFFLKGGIRVSLITVSAIFLGIKILLLFPVWLMGCLVYKYRHKAPNSVFLFWVSLTALLCIIVFGRDLQYNLAVRFIHPRYSLGNAAFFKYQYIVGILTAIHLFFAFGYLEHKSFSGRVITNAVKFLSSISFSIYLFHLPVFHLIQFFISYNVNSRLQVFIIFMFGLLCLILLSCLVERWKKFPFAKEKIYNFLYY